MIYTKKEQLTVIVLQDCEKSISIKRLKTVLEKYPSNVIYCELDGRLLGIISTGDILRAYEKKQNTVLINTKFICLEYGEYKRAKKIFDEKQNVHALPVVKKNNILIGDYTRWDDLSVLKFIIDQADLENSNEWKKGKNIALVRPNNIFKSREEAFKRMKAYLESQKVTVRSIKDTEIREYLKVSDEVLAVDENEIRAYNTALNVVYGDRYEGKDKLKTYKNFLKKEINFSDKQCAFYLEKLQKQGVKVIGLIFGESKFYKHLINEIESKFIIEGIKPCNKLTEAFYSDFFCELYSEEYANSIMNMPVEYRNDGGVLTLKNCRSQYYNVINGERRTLNQPDINTGSIYFFGPCYIYGHYVEDKNTIESLLSERILQSGVKKRVVNCGSLGSDNNNRYLFRIMAMQFKKGDIIIIDRPPQNITGVHYLDLSRVLEKKEISAKWFVDKVWHCNHKINRLYADAIYDVLLPILFEETDGNGETIGKDDNFIKNLYLNRYFNGFHASEYGKKGAIVMNCNPFTYGHRYLIEMALKLVDFLIVFVVEEDRSFFSFAERFTMVKNGVGDLDNVMVVPSGPFILSQMSFPEYFIKEKSENIKEHAEQDIRTFSEKIAPQLGIKYRIVGEEPEDTVTDQYNIAMKKILPEYGIELSEIPRKTSNGKYISASLVRKYVEGRDIDRLIEFLPETTRDLLGF